MSIKLTTTNLDEIRKIAEETLEKSDEAKSADERRALDADLDEVISYYKHIAKTAMINEAKASDDAMKYAINRFFYGVIKVKETEDKDTGVTYRSIVDAEAPIDLGELHKKLGGIGADPQWLHIAEKLNYHLTLRAAQRVGATVKHDSFMMNEISREIDLGKNPCSNTQMLKTLQTVITAMLGEGFKATSHDVNYLVDVYANDSKKSKTAISAANHKTLRNYLKKVCYRILNNLDGYSVEQKEIKG